MGDELGIDEISKRIPRNGNGTSSRERRDKRRKGGAGIGLDLTGLLPEPTKPRERKPLISLSGLLEKKDETKVKTAGVSRWAVVMGIDFPLLLAVVTLIIFGLLMVNSASWAYSLYQYGSANAFFLRQAALTGVGIVGAVVMSLVSYRLLLRFALPIMGLTLLGLIAVLVFGHEVFGATRTILSGSIQPSELAKIAIIIYLSVWLYNKREQLHDVTFGIFPLAAIIGVVGGLIALQPDLSALITIFALGGLMFYLAGGQLRQIGLLILGGAVLGFIIIQLNLFPEGKRRILEYVAGLSDPLNGSEHVQYSLEAFLRGGWIGVGIGQGQWKLTLLPVPHTDSIFAVIGEETGFVGILLVVALYAAILWRGLSIARRAPDQLGQLLAGGLTFWIFVEAFINMAVMLGLLPFAGNALPLISAGGSARIVTLAGIGILMNISREAEQAKGIKERNFGAVVDLRGRDWRRSVPRTRRPPSVSRH